jgi:signal transduction histidine kinase
LRDAVERQAGLLVDDLQAHPRAQQSLAKLEGIHSAIIVPMISDSHPIGALVLFKRSIASFTDADFDLASAAVAQLALAVRQAESIEEQRRHSNSLSSLYKVSRELTKYRGSVDFAEAVIPILKSEFALKRGWIGLLNDQGTCLVGQAGFGPGISRSRGSVQVQISTAHTIMQRILSNKGLQHITNPSDLSPEPILELFAGATSLMVIPMSTLGRVLGVVVLEPLTESSLASTDRHRLLATMANEMATALLAGKFDTKMAEALKMRMASLLASGVAHNFNNLLQAILGQVSLIDMQTPASSPVRTATKTITDAAQRGAALVSQLLSFASKGSARRIPTSVSQLLRDSESSYAALLGHSISLNLELQEGSGTLAHIDPTQFQEAMSKILANAREAIGGNPDGEVTISVHSAIVRSGELGPEVSPGTYVRVDIEDNGTGMSPEQQERCFEPFFTTKNADSATGVGLSGSGLGLAAAYAIIKDHDGIIAVHSSPGDGAVFSIYLPVTVESKDRVLLESSVDVVPSTDAPGVLLLGIETGVQSFLTKTLESLGYRARAVFDARQTHEVLRKEPAKWGTVLLDAEGLGGRCEATCQEIASTHPWIHVLCACSSAKEHEEAHKSAGVQPDPRVHHIEKPYTVWGLESALKRFDPSTSEVG